MIHPAYAAAFLATIISIAGHTRTVLKYHDRENPISLSELAAAQETLLNRFWVILWTCGTLFAVTVYLFIVPRISHAAFVAVAWSVTYVGNLVAAIIPARDRTFKYHNLAAQLMGLGMVTLAYSFWFNLGGMASIVEMVISLVMSALGILTFIDKKHFVFYGLAFVFLSHISIVIAAVALYASR